MIAIMNPKTLAIFRTDIVLLLPLPYSLAMLGSATNIP
jgi:hypothetical protein